jgi:hypothetical protein
MRGRGERQFKQVLGNLVPQLEDPYGGRAA